jgi:CDP-6-deoxy-D-xylo-4-hexulose-3-dehydrase
MLCTDDDDLAVMLKIVRANGWDRNLTSTQQHQWRKRFGVNSEFDAKYTFYDLGFNMRPTEITGFLGLYQLQFLEDNITKRERNYKYLETAVKENPELILLNHDHLQRLSNFAFPVLCKTPELRSKYLSQFSGAGVEIRPMIAGNMQKQPFYTKYVNTLYELPGTDFVHDCGFYCGNYPELTESDLETLMSCLRVY